jgi:hypothetical protein
MDRPDAQRQRSRRPRIAVAAAGGIEPAEFHQGPDGICADHEIDRDRALAVQRAMAAHGRAAALGEGVLGRSAETFIMRTAVVGSVKGRSPAPMGRGKMRRFRTFGCARITKSDRPL